MVDPNSNVYHFVWIQGLRGPWPQLWFGGLAGNDGKTKDHLEHYAISEEESKFHLDELARWYPYKGGTNGANGRGA